MEITFILVYKASYTENTNSNPREIVYFHKSSKIYTHENIYFHSIQEVPLLPYMTEIKHYVLQGTHGTGITGKMANKIPCQGKHREFRNFAKTQGKHREFVCSSCKFADFKGKRYCDICSENFHFFPRSWIGLPSQFCLCIWHKLCKLAQGKFAIRQEKHREKIGNLKIQFEWVPWC